MNKQDKKMTVKIIVYGEEVKITAPAFMLNGISLAFDYSSEYHKSRGHDALTECDRDISRQIYLELDRAGIYD